MANSQDPYALEYRRTGTTLYWAYAKPNASMPGYRYWETWYNQNAQRYDHREMTEAEWHETPTEYHAALDRWRELENR